MRRRQILAASLLCVACSDGAKNDDAPPPQPPPFSVDQAITVKISVSEALWDAVRYDDPGLVHFADQACPSGPRPSSFDWVSGTATVDGRDAGSVQIRKKGTKGSMSFSKPSLKIKFDYNNKRPYGLKRMTLNNGLQDPTHARECVTYHLFEKAGLAAPLCGLARVWVNGVDLGVYTHLEPIKKPLLRRAFGTSDGDLYEITAADFVPELTQMFEFKGDASAMFPTRLDEITRAFDRGDDELIGTLEGLIDLDAFFTYWAMEVLTTHWDGYAGNRNNSYVYIHPQTGLGHFIPWGVDQSFTIPVDFFGPFLGLDDVMPWTVYANGRLAKRLYQHPEGRRRYRQALDSALNDVWDDAEVFELLGRLRNTTMRNIEDDYTAIQTALEYNNLEVFLEQDWIELGRALREGLPDWDRQDNPPLCGVTNRLIRTTLTTELGTLMADIDSTGSGAATVSMGTDEMPLASVTGVADVYADWATSMSSIWSSRWGRSPTKTEPCSSQISVHRTRSPRRGGQSCSTSERGSPTWGGRTRPRDRHAPRDSSSMAR